MDGISFEVTTWIDWLPHWTPFVVLVFASYVLYRKTRLRSTLLMFIGWVMVLMGWIGRYFDIFVASFHEQPQEGFYAPSLLAEIYNFIVLMPMPGYILVAIGMTWFALSVRDYKHPG